MNLTSSKTINETFSNKIANVNGDISNINKRIFQCNIEHDNLNKLIKEEEKQRIIIEKKTYLMNETFTDQISYLKTGLNSLSTTLRESIEEIKSKIFEDVKKSNSKFIQSIESNLIKGDEFNQQMISFDKDKNRYNSEVEHKMTVLEDVIGSQLNNIHNELKATREMNGLLNQKIETNTQLMNESIKNMNKELNLIKNEIEMFKGFKLTSLETFGKISDDMISSNEQLQKCSSDVSLFIQSAESKMKHFENVFNRLNESFSEIKSDLSTQLDKINKNYTSKNEKMINDLLITIRESKSQMEQSNNNIVRENQKFIEYNLTQFNSLNINIKKLFEYSNDDIMLLKKKSESLESLIKTLRAEVFGYVNQIESSFTQRLNSIFNTSSPSYYNS